MVMTDFPWPYVIDEDKKMISCHVKSWMSAMAACRRLKERYPGYECQYVSEERINNLKGFKEADGVKERKRKE